MMRDCFKLAQVELPLELHCLQLTFESYQIFLFDWRSQEAENYHIDVNQSTFINKLKDFIIWRHKKYAEQSHRNGANKHAGESDNSIIKRAVIKVCVSKY